MILSYAKCINVYHLLLFIAGVVLAVAESQTGKDAALERKSTIIAFPRYRFLKIVSESATLVDERGVDE